MLIHRNTFILTTQFTLSLLLISFNLHADIGIKNTYRVSQHHFSQAYPATQDNTEPVHSDTDETPAIKLTPSKRRNVLSGAFAEAAEINGNVNNPILSQYAVKDLHLISGSTSAPEQSVLRNLGKTITVSGEVMLANVLLNPSTDITKLIRRQELIQYIIEQPELITQIENNLNTFSENEDGLISLLDPLDLINNPIFERMDPAEALGLKLDSSYSIEIFRRALQAWEVFDLTSLPSALIPILLAQIRQAGGIAASLPKSAFTIGGLILGEWFMIHLTKLMYQQEFAYYTYVIERTIRPAKALFSAMKLWETLENHPIFMDTLSNYPGFYQLKSSPEVKKILALLENPAEKPPTNFWEYFTTNAGRYQKAITLFAKHKDLLLPIIQATGEIDAWLTIVRFAKSGQQREKNPITFAHFIEQSASPSLHLSQFWSPHLEPKIAVPNNIKSGSGYPANTVITGPNAAGKSTNMDAIAIAVLLAQTFGVVPAQYAKITPFSLIHTHMDISAEVAAGLSTFKAETVRAMELMEHVEKMDQQQFSLSLMDEIFSSTNPTEGEAGTYGFLKIIANNSKAINICTTHYPRPILLAERYPDIFQNMHVRAEIIEGKLAYNYLLKPGPSQQHIAIRILEEEGVQPSFLDIATDIINYPERYPLNGSRQ